MPMNRVQFQPGLSMFEFLERYGTEEKCEAAVAAARWPDGFHAPRFAGKASYGFRRGRQPYRECAACVHQCSLITGTMFEATKLPLSRWFMAMQLISQAKNNVAALELRRRLGVSYPTAWLMKHKITEAMRLAERPRQLHDRVEIDDAYLGGERSGCKTGRGSENKVPFVLAVQTTGEGKPHQVCTAQLPFRRGVIAEFCVRHLVRPLTVVSDGLDCFRPTAAAWVHERIGTGGGASSARHPQFQAVIILPGNLKTAMSGTYHAFDFAKYTPRYLAELQFRCNRRYDMRSMLPSILRAMARSAACPEHGLRAPEFAS